LNDVLRNALIFLSNNNTARRFSMRAPGARTMARRFVAGETLDEGLNAARELVTKGFTVSLDYLGESVKSRAEAKAAGDMYIDMLQRIAADATMKQLVNVSMKLTQMGQDITRDGTMTGPAKAAHAKWKKPAPEVATPDGAGNWDEDFLRSNVTRILDVAKANDIFVRFDMEGTAHTQRTLDFFRSLWDTGYTNIGVVLQSYLRRTEHDVREANDGRIRVRLCKGAYKEPEQYAFQPKAEVDSNYVGLMKLLLSEGNYPGIATHDEAMIAATREYSKTRNIPVSNWEFQMLYGVRRDLQAQLRAEGYNLRVYVPFGEAWYPYLMRRMAERPANMLFIVSAVLRESPLKFLFRKKQ
jgi:proline dehydrogenase